MTIAGRSARARSCRRSTRRVLDPRSNRTSGCSSRSRALIRRWRPSGCDRCRRPAAAPRASPASATRSAPSTGSVSSATSTVPDRSRSSRCGVPPVVSFTSTSGCRRRYSFKKRREDVQADGHAAREVDRAGQLLVMLDDRGGRVADVSEHAPAELQRGSRRPASAAPCGPAGRTAVP